MTDQSNPAIVPEPEEPQPRSYRVTGQAQETLGHRHGETFTALLPADQEAALIAGGAIAPVNDEADRPDPASGDTGEADDAPPNPPDESHRDAETPDQPANQTSNRRRQPAAPDAPTTKE